LKNNLAFKDVFVAYFIDVQQTIALAKAVNQIGNFNAIIHNAGVYNASGKDIFNVNVLAPYILSCLLNKPESHIYVGYDMHLSGQKKLEVIKNKINHITYSDSKLNLLMLCKAFAHNLNGVYCNTIHPGWVPTKMGGKGAPDNLHNAFETQVWLASSNDKDALVTGYYFFHQKQSRYHIDADNITIQNQLIALCEDMTGVAFVN
jgi:NAD(P)-dependent dehydrogenase (short-subunit alcohol dehydrogenase family)